jgi:hypothetical protein
MLAVLLAAAHARADEPSADDRAKLATLLHAGANAAKAKQWDACIQALTAAAALDGAPTTWGELGLCEEAGGHFPAAHRHLFRALQNVSLETENKPPWKHYSEALRHAGERVAVVVVTVWPSDARVILDGRPLGAADGHLIPVEPGTHTFAAKLEGYEDQSITRALGASSFPNVDFRLKPKPKAEPPPVKPPQPAPKLPPLAVAPVHAPADAAAWYAPAPTTRGVVATLTYAAGAALIASGATVIGLDIDRGSLRKGLAGDACASDQAWPPARCAALHERRVQWDAAIGMTIGSAVATGVMVGVTGLAIGLDRSPVSPKIVPSVGPHGGGLVVLGAW